MSRFALLCVVLCACSGSGSTAVPIVGDGGMDAALADGATGDGSLDGAVARDATADASYCSPSGACSPFSDACIEGTACQPDDGGWACRALLTMTRGEGERCESDRECHAGLLCFGSGSEATCRKLCPTDSVGYCGSGLQCSGNFGDECVRSCKPRPVPCDIYAQDCTDPSLDCAFATDYETGAPYTACRTAGTRGRGESCADSTGACVRGHVCIRSEDGTATCRQVCRPDGGAPTCTTAGETCTGFAATWATGYCKPTL